MNQPPPLPYLPRIEYAKHLSVGLRQQNVQKTKRPRRSKKIFCLFFSHQTKRQTNDANRSKPCQAYHFIVSGCINLLSNDQVAAISSTVVVLCQPVVVVWHSQQLLLPLHRPDGSLVRGSACMLVANEGRRKIVDRAPTTD